MTLITKRDIQATRSHHSRHTERRLRAVLSIAISPRLDTQIIRFCASSADHAISPTQQIAESACTATDAPKGEQEEFGTVLAGSVDPLTNSWLFLHSSRAALPSRLHHSNCPARYVMELSLAPQISAALTFSLTYRHLVRVPFQGVPPGSGSPSMFGQVNGHYVSLLNIW